MRQILLSQSIYKIVEIKAANHKSNWQLRLTSNYQSHFSQSMSLANHRLKSNKDQTIKSTQ